MKCKSFTLPRRQSVGLSLIEVIVSVGLAMLAITAVLRASTTSLKSSQFASEKAASTKYAQQGMEIIRNERNTNWTSFFSHGGNSLATSCLTSGGVGWTNGSCTGANLGAKYTRQVQMLWNTFGDSDPVNDRMEVTLTVAWTNSGQPHTTELKTILTKI